MASINHKRRRYAAPIGGLFYTLAAVGIVTLAFLCLRLTLRVLDNSQEKTMFGEIVLPVVMFNPAPFEKADDIEMPNLLQYSMWSTLLGEKRNSYQFGDNGELIVPASDLDVAAAKLFGPDIKLVHQRFGDFDMTYFYDEENQVYNVPTSAQYNVYTPRVEEITKNGEFYEIYVGYIPSGVSWQTNFSGGRGQAEPEKYMNYIMQKSKDSYYIVKLQDPVNSTNSLPPPIQEQSAQEEPSSEIPDQPSSSEADADISSSEGEPDSEESPSSAESGDSSGEEGASSETEPEDAPSEIE